MKVYLYKCFNDGLAYGEEYIRVFARKEQAEKALEEGVLAAFKGATSATTLDELVKEPVFNGDMISKDFVSLPMANGDTDFYVVEEKEVYQ